MLYDLKNPLDRSRFERRAAALMKAETTAELTERKQRSTHQNSYLHLILGYFALETGYTLDYVKREYFKKLVNRDFFVREIDGALGRVEDIRSSRDLTKEEMSAAIERFRNWSSAEAGIYLPGTEEEEFLKQVEIELNKQNNWI